MNVVSDPTRFDDSQLIYQTFIANFQKIILFDDALVAAPLLFALSKQFAGLIVGDYLLALRALEQIMSIFFH